MKKFLYSLPAQNDGKIMLALGFIIVVAAFLLAGGYFKLSYSPQDKTLYDNPIPKDFTTKNNLQLEYLKFGTNSANTNPGGGSRGPQPTGNFCPKYVDLSDEQINSCKCSEVVLCTYKIPKEFCPPTTPTVAVNTSTPTQVPPGNAPGPLPIGPGLIQPNPAPPGNPGLDPTSEKQGQGCYSASHCSPGRPYCELAYYGASCSISEWNGITPDQCNQDFLAGLCEMQCLAKPVIYLYPTHPLFVDVKLEIPGRVTVSDPFYPEDGWKQVEAYPNPLGAIKYQGREYPYLYYETDVMKPEIPTQGFVVKTELLEPKLRDMLTKIGLIEHEQDDFIEYWIPMLQAENKPYMFITILPHEEKEKVDKVIMSVEPDTRIEVIFEFEPLDEFKIVTPLELPNHPPKREGFTMVEWGGAIN